MDQKEQDLVRRIKNRDETALLEVIDDYAPLLKSLIYKKLSFLPDEVEEVMNDTFLKIWDNIEQFDENKGTFRNWICAIANYRAVDRLRASYKKNNTLPLREDILMDKGNPEEIVLAMELFNGLLELLENLKDEDQEIFIDLFFEGMSYEEISIKYDISISNLYNRVSRGNKRLKENYGGE